MAVVQSAATVGVSSNYDSISIMQMAANLRHISHLTEALRQVDSPGTTLTVADFGSATGLNSMKAFSAAFQTFRDQSESSLRVPL